MTICGPSKFNSSVHRSRPD
ncbi:uncharacterized protein CELE_T19D2.13 [Caenorhabditis elegans]|uniref:Uncharacterized protein n=1 Tax=Caenorhabditis elegans TaxID=6239 RepID=A0A2K5AU19_CAEEL|nr:Uncharacterized protein CELE_T19D2.13 [Caenorhabditis elegans]SPC48679.2 Uncharacterized protein CELE_T19D2.13 [Caenorhabditis elegans]|eukprot:NP_001348818.2 Uncharacterized protein CELE_T19D2.13 [Caenorhabditis elegans]